MWKSILYYFFLPVEMKIDVVSIPPVYIVTENPKPRNVQSGRDLGNYKAFEVEYLLQ